jgi:RimJ/RimL family protein N-acetyltransferase
MAHHVPVRPIAAPVLEGERVRLEPLAMTHADALQAAADSGDDVWSWLAYDLRRREQLSKWLEEALRQRDGGQEVPFAVVWKPEGRVVGSTRLMDIQPRHRGLEIGWTWYRRDLWGSKLNPECKLLLLRHAFETWGAIRVCLKTDVKNVHSQEAIKKLGAKYEGTLRNHYIRRDGTYRDSVYFSIIESEWPAVRRALEERLASFAGA